MANTQISIKRIYFDIEDEHTVCSVFNESTEPDNPFWGDGWRHKKYGKDVSVITILKELAEDMDYLTWEKGRHVPPEYKFKEG